MPNNYKATFFTIQCMGQIKHLAAWAVRLQTFDCPVVPNYNSIPNSPLCRLNPWSFWGSTLSRLEAPFSFVWLTDLEVNSGSFLSMIADFLSNSAFFAAFISEQILLHSSGSGISLPCIMRVATGGAVMALDVSY